MKAWIVALAALLLSACATVPKPLTPDVASRVKQGKTAVLFNDDIGEIKYIEDKYFVLGVAQVASSSAYSGIWKSNEELSKLHAAQLSTLGLNATPAYSVLPSAFIEQHAATDRDLYTLRPAPKAASKAVGAPAREGAISPALRDALLEKGQDSLVWVAWSGFTLHIQTLGLPPMENMQLGMWMVDLKENKVIWSGRFLTLEKAAGMGDKTGKDFLESNDLSGLKTEVSERMREYYMPDKYKKADVATLAGL